MNKYCRHMLALFLAGGVFLTGQTTLAITIIDTFDNASGGLWPLVANAGTPLVANSNGGLVGVVGGVRDGSVSWSSGPLNVTGAVLTGPGIYSLSSDALTDGLATLSYDAGGAGLNLDLTLETSILIDVVSADLGGVPISVTLTDGGASNSTAGAVAAGGGQVSIPFTSFSGLDFSDIDDISIEFNPPQEFDITVDTISAVPEPSSFFLLGLSIGIFAIYRRFRER